MAVFCCIGTVTSLRSSRTHAGYLSRPLFSVLPTNPVTLTSSVHDNIDTVYGPLERRLLSVPAQATAGL